MASDDAQVELRSVILLAGHFDQLLSGSASGFSQLDGVLELLDFANSYVLSDRIAIGGAPVLGVGDISWFLHDLAQETQAIEVIGHGPLYRQFGFADTDGELEPTEATGQGIVGRRFVRITTRRRRIWFSRLPAKSLFRRNNFLPNGHPCTVQICSDHPK